MMTIEQVLTRLETRDYAVFQREALEQAILQQTAITPALVEIIARIADNPQLLEEDPDYMGFTYALYLLAQFREKTSYPLIVQYFGQLGLENSALDATGDLVTEDLSRILASVCHGDLGLIKRLIEDQKVNIYVRSAAFGALVALYNNEQLPRVELVAYFRTLIERSLEQQEDPYFVGNLVSVCCDIHPEELYDALVVCFDRDLIDQDMINRQDLDHYMGMEKQQVLAKLKSDRHSQLINNVIAEMEWWACFHPKPAVKKPPSAGIGTDKKAKVGRNDPCPCGSGKKFKKCCLH